MPLLLQSFSAPEVGGEPESDEHHPDEGEADHQLQEGLDTDVVVDDVNELARERRRRRSSNDVCRCLHHDQELLTVGLI